MTADIQKQGMTFKDRKKWLVVFGVIELLIGVIAAISMFLIFPMLIMMPSVADESSTSIDKNMIATFATVYGVAAIYFIWIGVGSIMVRRWARAVMLIVSAYWFIIGTLGYVMAHIGTLRTPSGEQNSNYLGNRFSVLVLIILPAVFFLFYRSPHVKATCEQRDSILRWTDKLPLPIIAVLFWLSISAVSYFWSLFASKHVSTFMGMIIVGLPAVVITLVRGGMYIYLAIQVYKMKMIGWTATLIYSIIDFCSISLSYLLIDERQYLAAAGCSAAQIEKMHTIKVWGEPYLSLMFAVLLIIWVGYLLYVRKYFITVEDRK